jgi:hypothetical protein
MLLKGPELIVMQSSILSADGQNQPERVNRSTLKNAIYNRHEIGEVCIINHIRRHNL